MSIKVTVYVKCPLNKGNLIDVTAGNAKMHHFDLQFTLKPTLSQYKQGIKSNPYNRAVTFPK